jgi:hypothetical protein
MVSGALPQIGDTPPTFPLSTTAILISSVDEDVPIHVLLQLRDLLDDIALQDNRVSPFGGVLDTSKTERSTSSTAVRVRDAARDAHLVVSRTVSGEPRSSASTEWPGRPCADSVIAHRAY